MPGFMSKQAMQGELSSVGKHAFQGELKSLVQQVGSWGLDFNDGSEKSQSTMPGAVSSMGKHAFQGELESLAQQVESWGRDFMNGSEKSQSTALLLKGTGEDKAGELKELLKNLQGEHGRLQTTMGDQRDAMSKYIEWIAFVKERHAQFTDRITQLLETKRRGEDKVSVAMADISSKLEHRKQKLDALRKATSWYKELLGIRCEYSNAVRFIFTNIDASNPDREFTFSIHHDKLANKFSMVDCNPNIEKSAPLLDALNTSNELSQFVRSMRWEFVSLSAAETEDSRGDIVFSRLGIGARNRHLLTNEVQ